MKCKNKICPNAINEVEFGKKALDIDHRNYPYREYDEDQCPLCGEDLK